LRRYLRAGVLNSEGDGPWYVVLNCNMKGWWGFRGVFNVGLHTNAHGDEFGFGLGARIFENTGSCETVLTVTSCYPFRMLVGTSFLQSHGEKLNFRRFTLFETSFVSTVVGIVKFPIKSLEECVLPLFEGTVP